MRRVSTQPTQDHLSIAGYVADAFGGDFRVRGSRDHDGRSTVDILRVADCPGAGLTAYSTIGLSDTPNPVGKPPRDSRVELVGSCATGVKKFENVLGTASHCLLKSGWPCFEGALFPDVLKMYSVSKTMKHLLLAKPFLWRGLKKLRLAEKSVNWLMIVPISEREYKLAESEGSPQLADVLMRSDVDLLDVHRPSVI